MQLPFHHVASKKRKIKNHRSFCCHRTSWLLIGPGIFVLSLLSILVIQYVKIEAELQDVHTLVEKIQYLENSIDATEKLSSLSGRLQTIELNTGSDAALHQQQNQNIERSPSPSTIITPMLREKANFESEQVAIVDRESTTPNTEKSSLVDRNVFRCDVDSPVPVWSWAITRTCCDIFPQNAETFPSIADPNNFDQNHIMDGSVVYVFEPDFTRFMTVLEPLPSHIRIILVTGMGDYGAPFELLGPQQKIFYDAPTFDQERTDAVRKLLANEKIFRWYAQNYDLVGCNPLTALCSNIQESEYAHKIVPIPIGLDLHTHAGKGKMESEAFQQDTCTQRKLIKQILDESPSFISKKFAIVSAIGCDFSQASVERVHGRGLLCELMGQRRDEGSPAGTLRRSDVHDSSNDHVDLVHAGGSRDVFWRALQHTMFAFAPFGYGLDTHRLWETLSLHSVPIVLSSPLDRLYKQFPVIILQHWEDAFNSSFLVESKLRLQEQYGIEPFANKDVLRRLTLGYWTRLIRSSADEILTAN